MDEYIFLFLTRLIDSERCWKRGRGREICKKFINPRNILPPTWNRWFSSIEEKTTRFRRRKAKKNPKRNGRLYTLPNHIFPIQSAFPRLFSRTKNHSSPRTPRRGGKERRKKNRDAGGKGIVGEERPRNIIQSADSGCSRPSIIAADMS